MPKRTSNQNSIPRPPVVTLLGHVDHGKTSLLSKIKGQDLTKGEFGGISQHINAYQIEKEFEGEPKKITFIDTPGHEAFSKMRSRGGTIADLVLLVVAADDGVQPQTEEAVAYARQANVPIMVALNKMDLEKAQPDKVRKDLAELGLTPEEWGGQTTIVEVSAKTGRGIDELLEMILLWAETSELTADPEGKLSGVVIESHLDPRRGPMAKVLIKNGTLSLGEEISAGTAQAKVKAMFLEGKRTSSAGPSTPVEVLGFSKVPEVGEEIKPGARKIEAKTSAASTRKITTKKDEKVLNVILKADTVGTAQAVEAAVEPIKVGDFKIQILQSSIGEITDSDVRLASDPNAQIFAFNTGFSLGAEELAKDLKVKVKRYNVIYQLIKEASEALEKKRNEFEGRLAGMGEVIKVFTLPLSQDKIAGTRIIAGAIKTGDRVSVSRGSERIHQGKVKSIHQERKEIKEAEKGTEVGLYIKPQWNVEVGDIIEAV